MRQRRHGSVRFDPYFKIQTYDRRSFTWRDVQRQYDSEAEARAAFPAGERARVMRVTEQGRSPLPE